MVGKVIMTNKGLGVTYSSVFLRMLLNVYYMSKSIVKSIVFFYSGISGKRNKMPDTLSSSNDVYKNFQ